MNPHTHLETATGTALVSLPPHGLAAQQTDKVKITDLTSKPSNGPIHHISPTS